MKKQYQNPQICVFNDRDSDVLTASLLQGGLCEEIGGIKFGDL